MASGRDGRGSKFHEGCREFRRRDDQRREDRLRVAEARVVQGDGPSQSTAQGRAHEVGDGLAGNHAGEPLVHRGTPVGQGAPGLGADPVDSPGQLLSVPLGFAEQFAKAGVRHAMDAHVSPAGSSTPRRRMPDPASEARGRATHSPQS